MSQSASSWEPFTTSSTAFRGPIEHGVDQSPYFVPDHAHRRTYSEVHAPSRFNSYALQPPGFQERQRRSSSWDLGSDSDLRHRKRVATYEMFALEKKVKSTVKRSFRWVKGKCHKLVYGFKWDGCYHLWRVDVYYRNLHWDHRLHDVFYRDLLWAHHFGDVLRTAVIYVYNVFGSS